MDITVTLPDNGKKVLDSWLGADEMQAWLQHAAENKLRQRVDASIIEETDKNPQKIDQTDKLTLLEDVKLPTREERDEKEKEGEEEKKASKN